MFLTASNMSDLHQLNMQKQDGKGRDREKRNEWFRAPRRSASIRARPRAERGRTQGEDDEQEDPVQGLRDDARGLDDCCSQRVANSARGSGAGVLDAGVSASMITNRTRSAD